MTKIELQSLPYFKIFNEFGSIEWSGPVDLTYVDLGQTIKIDADGIEVYPDNVNKHPVGTKLNKEALITMCNVRLGPNQSVEDKEDKLQRKIAKDDGEHVYYDSDNAIWVFKVPYFK